MPDDAPAPLPAPAPRAGGPTADAAPAFAERLWPGPGGWVLVGAVVVMVTVVLVPLGSVAAVLGLLTGALLAAVGVVLLTPRVEVRSGELLAGPAHVPLELLGEARVLAGEELRHALGPGLDARAYLCLRGWVRTAVRVELCDPQDPTPYWVVSTRRPEQLVAALRAGR
ncbi:DUF3093 domain-containing protein [Cellulomonas massiliensis]|uniref:DUF3093 domain-containing protein n=1 Tax=Cellulomonas massiliensis TaxID=1465811 RepID=UPI0003141F79|nr:DUF3093 domain-containing protein [Cellulomonas massiliensis]